MNVHPTFEETYPRYEFSELVRLAIAIGGIFRTLRVAKAPWRSASPPLATTAPDLKP